MVLVRVGRMDSFVKGCVITYDEMIFVRIEELEKKYNVVASYN